jgi:magnesium-transporting ATPase (P-type)
VLQGAPDFIVGSRVYSQPEQMDIYQESVSAWYATLVACQFWHVWLCKTRIESIFVHGLFDNFVTIMGVAISVVLLIACVYVPFLQYIFFTYALRYVP